MQFVLDYGELASESITLKTFLPVPIELRPLVNITWNNYLFSPYTLVNMPIKKPDRILGKHKEAIWGYSLLNSFTFFK